MQGWTFGVGDVVALEVDYYNSVVAFVKNSQDDDS